MSYAIQTKGKLETAEKELKELEEYIKALKLILMRESSLSLVEFEEKLASLFEHNQFKGRKLAECIIELLKQNSEKSFSPAEIIDEVLKRGFDAKPKSLASNVRTILFLKKKDGPIEQDKSSGKSRYRYKNEK